MASLVTRRAVQIPSGAIAPGTEPHSGLSQHTNPLLCDPASSGGWLLPQGVDELPDLGLGVGAVPTQGLQERQLALLGQRDTVLGETWRMSATSAGSR